MKPMIRTFHPKQMTFLSNDLENCIDKSAPLLKLGERINWKIFNERFLPLYSDRRGRPAKNIRLMVSLLILKQMNNLSDERVIIDWKRNFYYQSFSGIREFQSFSPCSRSQLTHFRKRIGEKGMELILTKII